MNWFTIRSALAHLGRLGRGQSGQAMVEYAAITGLMVVPAFFIGDKFLFPELLRAINIYLDGVYFILNAPLP